MELDLPMYKEAYRNIATSIKELEMPDNKQEIKKLEELIERNQTQIRAFGEADYEAADHSVWFDEATFIEHENARFEEYAEPFNANIMEAQKMITELENGMEENQKGLKENKAKQAQLKVHADKVRENAKKDYEKARKEAAEEWENSEEKKKYDSNMETISIINSRRPNLIKAEEEALIRLNGENIKLQQTLGHKLKQLEDDYNKFLEELDEIDKEFGIDKLEEKTEENQKNDGQTTPTQSNPAEPNPAKPNPGKPNPTPTQPNPGQTNSDPTNGDNNTSNNVKFRSGPSIDQESPIRKLVLTTNKDGIMIGLHREDGGIFGDWNPTKLSKVHSQINSHEDVNKEIVERARSVGDEFIVDKILGSTILTTEEKEEQLSKYTTMLVEPLSDSQKSKLKKEFNIKYDLRGMNKEDRKAVKQYAKQARDLGIGEVKAPWYINFEWAAKDWINEHEWAKKALSGIKSLGTGMKKGVAGLLAKGKEEQQAHDEEVVENDEPAVTNSTETRVAGVERVEVDVAEVVNNPRTESQEQEAEAEK